MRFAHFFLELFSYRCFTHFNNFCHTKKITLARWWIQVDRTSCAVFLNTYSDQFRKIVAMIQARIFMNTRKIKIFLNWPKYLIYKGESLFVLYVFESSRSQCNQTLHEFFFHQAEGRGLFLFRKKSVFARKCLSVDSTNDIAAFISVTNCEGNCLCLSAWWCLVSSVHSQLSLSFY